MEEEYEFDHQRFPPRCEKRVMTIWAYSFNVPCRSRVVGFLLIQLEALNRCDSSVKSEAERDDGRSSAVSHLSQIRQTVYCMSLIQRCSLRTAAAVGYPRGLWAHARACLRQGWTTPLTTLHRAAGMYAHLLVFEVRCSATLCLPPSPLNGV